MSLRSASEKFNISTDCFQSFSTLEFDIIILSRDGSLMLFVSLCTLGFPPIKKNRSSNRNMHAHSPVESHAENVEPKTVQPEILRARRTKPTPLKLRTAVLVLWELVGY